MTGTRTLYLAVLPCGAASQVWRKIINFQRFDMVVHLGDAPSQPEGISFTDCAASLAEYWTI